jgi:hypothetical protein
MFAKLQPCQADHDEQRPENENSSQNNKAQSPGSADNAPRRLRRRGELKLFQGRRRFFSSFCKPCCR